ncbi:hypothetical protein Tco_0579315 [Tanacetum coccineum]
MMNPCVNQPLIRNLLKRCANVDSDAKMLYDALYCSILELYIMVCLKRLEVKEQESYNFNSVMKGTGATLDAKTTSAVGFKHPVYRRKRGATKVVESGNVSSKLVVDHVAQKGISGLKGGDSDANVSFMPIRKDPRGDLVTEPCSTSNVSAIDSQIDKRPDKQIHRHQTDRNLTGSNSTSFVIATVPPPQDAFSPDYKTTLDVYGASLKCEEPSQASDYSELLEILDNVETKMALNGEGVRDNLPSDMLTKMAPNDELENIFELIKVHASLVVVSNLQYNAIRFAITVLTAAILGVVFFRNGEKMALNQNAMHPFDALENTVFHRERAVGVYLLLPYAIAQVAHPWVAVFIYVVASLQSQAAAADSDFFNRLHVMDEEDSNINLKAFNSAA